MISQHLSDLADTCGINIQELHSSARQYESVYGNRWSFHLEADLSVRAEAANLDKRLAKKRMELSELNKHKEEKELDKAILEAKGGAA